MSDLKLNGITPDGVGKIKLGSSDVQKIYSGSTLVWPTSLGPGEVEICDAIWKKANSTTLAKVGGGNIDFANNGDDWVDAYQNQIPTACYFEFDSNNASYGLIYNYWAKDVIQPPAGFKLPSSTELGELLQCYGQNDNPLGANPGSWNTDLLTNTTGLGSSGFNANGYGLVYVETLNSTAVWTKKGEREIYWSDYYGSELAGIEVAFYSNGHLIGVSGFSSPAIWGTFIRFIKE